MTKKNKGTGRVLQRVGSVCGIAVILLQLVPMLPRLFGMSMFAISSGSMEPEIPTGSMVYAKKAEPETLRGGDIIVYASSVDGGFVTHRVTANDPEAENLTTKGDANQVEDPLPVAYRNVFGKVSWHLPLLGYVLDKTGRAVCVVIFLVSFGLTMLGQKGKTEHVSDVEEA